MEPDDAEPDDAEPDETGPDVPPLPDDTPPPAAPARGTEVDTHIGVGRPVPPVGAFAVAVEPLGATTIGGQEAQAAMAGGGFGALLPVDGPDDAEPVTIWQPGWQGADLNGLTVLRSVDVAPEDVYEVTVPLGRSVVTGDEPAGAGW